MNTLIAIAQLCAGISGGLDCQKSYLRCVRIARSAFPHYPTLRCVTDGGTGLSRCYDEDTALGDCVMQRHEPPTPNEGGVKSVGPLVIPPGGAPMRVFR